MCNKDLGIPVTLDQIGRSHVVGTPDKGRCQIIARFTSYRVRHKVYVAKSKLKNDSQKRYIVEDLTRTRYNMVKRLSQLRHTGSLSQYWTFDGRVFARETDTGPKILLKTMEDIDSRFGG